MKKQHKKHIDRVVNAHSKIPIWGMLLFVLLFFIIAISSVYFRYQLIVAQRQQQYPLQIWQPGEIVTDDRFAFSFNSVSTDAKDIPGVWELPPDSRYVIVNVSFKNNQTVDYQLSPILTMSLLDDQGKTHQVTSAPHIKDSLGGPVKPGQTVRGEVGFTLPANVTNGQFIFEPQLSDAHQIRVSFKL